MTLSHTLSITEFESALSTGRNGLSNTQAHLRITEHGPNELESDSGLSAASILLRQVCNAMIVVLLISMAVAFGIRDFIAGGVIAAVVVINVVVGFYEEVKAEKTMGALKTLSAPTAKVFRHQKLTEEKQIHPMEEKKGEPKSETASDSLKLTQSDQQELGAALDLTPQTIDAKELVPGDLIALKVGDTVPADCRLLSVVNFEADEAMLTGESLPVVKVSDTTLEAGTGVGDRINMVFSGTVVSKGRALAYVAATGMNTEIGAIARSLQQKSQFSFLGAVAAFFGVSVGTPLHRQLSKLALSLFGLAVVLAIVVLAAAKFKVSREVAVYAIVVAISMIPGSLVVVLTISMTAGAKAMAQRHVIVRKLDSLEALGAVSAICSDKTGTLTQGKMVAQKLWLMDGQEIVVQADEPYNPESGSLSTRPERSELFMAWLATASRANVASLHYDGTWKASGDPTEIAIRVLTRRFDDFKLAPAEHVCEYPFDSTLKRMTSVFKTDDETFQVYTKGAVERILDACNADTLDAAQIAAKVDDLASGGLRVLAFATKSCSTAPSSRKDAETELIFLGLVGLYDPPRPESEDAVSRCHQAGIQVIMLTGDHPGTARSIAKTIGILRPGDLVVTAAEFDAMDDATVDAMVSLPTVVARCSPQTKVRMIHALRRRNMFTAMTGDGVNDSPSLRMADVGIAMGKNGSDVAKDASDIVLSDDNFASILNAVEEGRRMADNVAKFVLHLLAGNVAQALVLMIGLAFRDETGVSVFPISPVEALWIIMVTASFPAMGLGMEKVHRNAMSRPPRDPKTSLFTWELLCDLLAYGVIIATICVVTFAAYIYGGVTQLGQECNEQFSDSCNQVFRARSTVFLQLTWTFLLLAWEVNDPESLLQSRFADLWANQLLFWSIVVGFISVVPVVYIPVINRDVFKHGPITWEWAVAVIGTLLFLVGAELYKWAKRLFHKRKPRSRISEISVSEV